MESEPLSTAEQLAEHAQSLPSFANFNLLGVRSSIKELLRSIGTTGAFNQYTRHDITHIDVLLQMLDWIVIPSTRAQMTPTDWLLLVLSIYLHDAGMVVSQNEYASRGDCSLYGLFKTSIDAETATPYKEKFLSLSDDAQDIFLYQEFVRTYHAQRVKSWIIGDQSNKFGIANEAQSIVSELLIKLPRSFRDDVALVCESHHLDDLDNLAKYTPQRPYGSALQETANLQFAAILLRTVDLLHVTQDRAPSIAFRLSTPTDPKSIEEWYKQMPVVAVRVSKPRDDQGNVKPEQVPDTIAITAEFTDPKGFFSLTEYLFYAESELKRSYLWAEQTRIKESLPYSFPWRKIESAGVKAINFESKQFVFELDKPKILKLLTGHTLYSNPDVVIRELVQNSLDASRLQFLDNPDKGTISLHFSSKNRVFTIDDNGTGMTQHIIESHFLNVGSSRYSDETFKKTHPGFSAISRFGIGILSVFMVSDEIEVLTKSSEDEWVKNISIRSLNGRYLIRSLAPTDPDVPEIIRDHGTRITLKMRAGVATPDIRAIAKFWILFPNCKVTTQVDDGPVVTIGFGSPKQALENTLSDLGIALFSGETDGIGPRYKVVQHEKNGLQIAYALEWSSMYRVWNFAAADRLLQSAAPETSLSFPVAMCVQGIRVDGASPGFNGRPLLAVSNSLGQMSPATNVARSTLESSPQLDDMLTNVYQCYADHIEGEVLALAGERGLSVSAAASEGRFLLYPLYATPPSEVSNRSTELFNASVRRIPLLTIDKGEQRDSVSLSTLQESEGFWTVDSLAFRSADEFIQRMPTGVSFSKLINLGFARVAIPDNIVSGYTEGAHIRDLFLDCFEVNRIEVEQQDRQASFQWSSRATTPLWRNALPSRGVDKGRLNQTVSLIGQVARGVRLHSLVYQRSDVVVVKGIINEVGVKSSGRTYLFGGNPVHDALMKQLDDVERGTIDVADYVLAVAVLILVSSFGEAATPVLRQRALDQTKQQMGAHLQKELSISEELREIICNHELNIFNPLAGARNFGSAAYGALYDYE